ncbi:hypothetical protein BCLUESOX_675 [bacterium endosymbiont of Bathymodiolus sp. 5 South]|nr:hypothetical protein [uncultured Gammaproteobacteria bacterium]SHN93504.1 hypothetical protein BCLUESOX_675 [bacterium endosymbiont of Bathymodiolus sp. 5 South]
MHYFLHPLNRTRVFRSALKVIACNLTRVSNIYKNLIAT